MKEYISVSEYAKIEGISVQAVYKRLNGSLKPFLIVKDGKKLIKSECLSSTYSTTFKPEFKTDSTLDSTIVEMLKAQLEVKDRQIEALQKQNEALTAALTAAQALHAGTMQEIKEISVNEDKASTDPGRSVYEDNAPGGLLRRFARRRRKSADH